MGGPPILSGFSCVREKLRAALFNAVYKLGGGLAYAVKRGFEFGHVFTAVPGSDIGEGVFRGIYPKMLADDIGDALPLLQWFVYPFLVLQPVYRPPPGLHGALHGKSHV